MTSHQLARRLLAQPDLPIVVANEDYSRSEVTGLMVHSERPAPGAQPQPALIYLRTTAADWED